MNNIANIIFIYDTMANICLLKEGKTIRELTIKGSCKYQGIVNALDFKSTKRKTIEYLFAKTNLDQINEKLFVKVLMASK